MRAARRLANPRFDHIRPSAVAFCESADDVREAITVARRLGVHAVPRSGGHCFAGRSSTTGLVIDVSGINSVEVAEGIAVVGAGCRLGDLYDALDAHGVTIPAGCGPAVGIAGLTLGGGLGILGRVYGLTCDRLVRAQIVLADGRILGCDSEHDPELFWALRGAGGGQFGIVTSLAFRTVPAPVATTTFHLSWPWNTAASVIEAWQGWAPDAPDKLNANLKLTASGDADAEPLVHLFGAMLGSDADTLELLEQFAGRVGSEPRAGTHRHLGYRQAKQALDGVGSVEEPANRGWRTASPSSSARPCRRTSSACCCSSSPRDALAGRFASSISPNWEVRTTARPPMPPRSPIARSAT